MTITQTVEVPETRWLNFKVPQEIPVGETANVIIQFPVKEKPMAAASLQTTAGHESLAEHVQKYVEEQKRIVETEIMPIKPGLGCLKGKIWMADDFCEPLEDFKDYM